MPYDNGDPKRDHNLDNHPCRIQPKCPRPLSPTPFLRYKILYVEDSTDNAGHSSKGERHWGWGLCTVPKKVEIEMGTRMLIRTSLSRPVFYWI